MTTCILFSRCKVLEISNKQEFKDGFYTQHINNQKQRVYIDITDDSITIYPSNISNHIRRVEKNTVLSVFQKEIQRDFKQSHSYTKASFDIDFFTIPLKFRPIQNNVPAQLNTNLNGAIYLGYRIDKFLLNYIPNPLGKSDRKINHVGFSMGAYSGIGNTTMSPTNTNFFLQQEYDGIIWSKGLAGFFALNSFTVGLTLGIDHLLDSNNTIWIYEAKPYLGLAFGLNLN